jgi:hypothetical protein
MFISRCRRVAKFTGHRPLGEVDLSWRLCSVHLREFSAHIGAGGVKDDLHAVTMCGIRPSTPSEVV